MAGGPASPASDVYAATATFYECLTGRPPFTGDDADLIRQHRFESVPLEPVPEPLRPLIAAGMAKNPAHRPADATTFVTELKTAAPGACGRDWHERGRSHLGEAALLLAILWPAGPPPAVEGSAVEQVHLSRGSRESRHWWHIRQKEHEQHEERLRRLRRPRLTRTAVVAGVALTVLAAGTVLAATVAARPAAPSHPAAVQSLSLQPSSARPSLNAAPGTLPSRSQTSQSGPSPSRTQISQSGPARHSRPGWWPSC